MQGGNAIIVHPISYKKLSNECARNKQKTRYTFLYLSTFYGDETLPNIKLRCRFCFYHYQNVYMT